MLFQSSKLVQYTYCSHYCEINEEVLVAPDLEELYSSFSKGLTSTGPMKICLSWYVSHILEGVIDVKDTFVRYAKILYGLYYFSFSEEKSPHEVISFEN